MKRIALVLALVLVASFAYAGDGDVAISDARGNKSILGDYNTTTKRIKTDSSGNLAVAGTGTAGTAAGGVLTVQGAASMTPVIVTGDSAGSLTVDASNLDIRDLTSVSDSVEVKQATATNLKAQVVGAGTAGTADANPVTVQGIASMTPIIITGDDAGSLTVDGAVTVSATDLDIRALSSTTDSVSIEGGNTTDVKVTLDSESVAVTGTFWQTTQPVSATDLDIRDLSSVTDTISAVQSGTWNIGSVTTLPAITGSVTADTELPTAAELADDLANPTITALGSYNLVYDGSTWDRLRGDSTDGVLVNLGTNNDVTVTGTVTANAGTNLNTSALALEATLGKLTIAQNADLGTNTQALVGGSVTTEAPTYTTGKIQPFSLTTTGALRTSAVFEGTIGEVDVNPASSIVSGQKNVTSTGTDEVLAGSTAILSVTIKAKPNNTGYIYVGTEGVSSTTGYILSKDEAVSLDTDNLADIWLDCSVNGEGVSYIAVVK